MSLFDLLCIGIGGTVGSGVFVLSGLIAREYAGPAVILSFFIAGVCCLFSAASYGELSCRIPTAGSSYAYVYVSLGEYLAVIAAWSLSLEYGISGAAVARSWGDKVVTYANSFDNVNISNSTLLGSGDDWVGSINILAGLLQIICVIILLAGIDVGKLTVNIFTAGKVILILFMIIAGISMFQAKNIEHFVPLGYSGVMRGATSCFFGYVGYDEVI
jgi:APA family basic amino acid/polyamine antiporter